MVHIARGGADHPLSGIGNRTRCHRMGATIKPFESMIRFTDSTMSSKNTLLSL